MRPRAVGGRLRVLLVFPPITGRLHCGLWVDLMADAARLVFPPITGRLHCGAEFSALLDVSSDRVSAHNRAAPLRLQHATVTGVHGTVFPPITGRLHCGILRGLVIDLSRMPCFRP